MFSTRSFSSSRYYEVLETSFLFLEELGDLGDDVISLMVFNRNWSQVFTSKCGPGGMSSSPRSSSTTKFQERIHGSIA